MISAVDLILRRAQLPDGRVVDVSMAEGSFVAIAPKLPPSDNDIDCSGKLLLAGLHDHHIHLLATAAGLQSVDLSGCADTDDIVTALHAKAKDIAPTNWVRAIGYDERVAGISDRHSLDVWLPDHPLRVQDRTGALWVLNSIGLKLIGSAPWPEAVETDACGEPTGRIWRGDDWLRQQTGSHPPPLRSLSQQLAKWGVTAVTDAGANNGPEEANILSAAIRNGELLQRLLLMGREDLPAGEVYVRGAVKLLFDERALPTIDSIAARIVAARALGRAVAAHCVTEGELVTFLAALEQAGGARVGDRIEHGSIIPHSLIADISAAQLTVVANPGFIARRGDRYLAEIDPVELPNLQRLGSLVNGGISISAGSDAPYGPANPWVAIRAAMCRKTPLGAILGANEALPNQAALSLFSNNHPIQSGSVADCCLIDASWPTKVSADENPNPVAFTLIGGKLA